MNDAKLQKLIDRQKISDILIEYCCAPDRMDLPAIAALFTKDCIVDYGPDKRLQSHGSSALAKSLERMWRWSRTSHHLSNIQIQFEGSDSSSTVSYVLAWHERPDGSTATIMGQYHDRLVREMEDWKIKERRMVMNGCDTGFTVNINPFKRISAPKGWKAPDIDRYNN